MYVLIGARKKEHILCEKDFKKLGAEIIVATEDGSSGKKGLVTACLDSLLSTIDYGPSTIYACGPMPMLKAVSRIAASHNISCQVSLEERMACGVGVCLGCPVKVKAQHPVSMSGRQAGNMQYQVPGTQYEYKMVCKDGPVFDAKDIMW